MNESLLEVLEAHTQSVRDYFDAVKGGRLRILAPILLLGINVNFARERQRYNQLRSLAKGRTVEEATFHADAEANDKLCFVKTVFVSEEDNQLVTAQLSSTGHVRETMLIKLDKYTRLTCDSKFERQPKYFMPAALGTTNHGPPEGYLRWYGLLIEPISVSRGAFRRLGLWRPVLKN